MVKLESTSNLLLRDYAVISEQASPAEVVAQVEAMSWSELSGLRLSWRDDFYLEGSGSLEDGFSMVYAEGAVEHITVEAPTFEILAHGHKSFAAGDGRWRELVEWEFFQRRR